MKRNNFHRFYLIVFFFSCFINAAAQQKLLKKGNDYYLSNTIVVKLKQASGFGNNIDLPNKVKKVMEQYSVVSAKNSFTEKQNSLFKQSDNLNKTVTIEYSSNEDPYKVASKLLNTGEVIWAEPHYVREVFYTPNDPSFNLSTQWGLFQIKAESAWDITKGDTSIVIGIIDTGVYWEHPDLTANIWQNLKEDANHNGKTIIKQGDTWILDPGDLNGIDDDGNGYVDDLIGWDFGGLNGTGDNNPQEDTTAHGTLVAGLASAVTDNNNGIASMGFKCRIMPVKTTRHDFGDKLIVYGFEGIRYAADNGAKIINCSFGGTVFSNAEQEAVDYAVSKGALVVAAAGNSGNDIPQYPASYKGVLSVGATTHDKNFNDIIWSESSYGTHVKVMAPGAIIYSTWGKDGYLAPSGTSLSSPITAGLAALVASKFTTYTPLQIAEQIRANCDPMDEINAAQYTNLMGSGRVNAYKALTNENSVSVRIDSVLFSSNGKSKTNFAPGDTVSIGVKFINYLKPVSGLSVSVISESDYAVMLQKDFYISSMNTLESVDNYSNKFIFKISDTVPYDTEISFLVNYSSVGYSDFEWITIKINSTYETMSANNISFTITSRGSFGFNDFPNNTEGSGFVFRNGDNLMYEGAFMYGTAADTLLDEARTVNETKSTDFNLVDPFRLSNSESAEYENGYTAFNEDSGLLKRLGIKTKINTYEFRDEANSNYVIISADLYNYNSTDITKLYAGLFIDWDLEGTDYTDDIVNYDSVNNFGYAYDSNGIPVSDYVGAALISDNNYGFYAIDNGDTTSGAVETLSNFTDAEKWKTISSGIAKTEAGPSDISFVISGGPYNIPVNHHVNVSFALGAGRDLDELTTTMKNARIKYGSIPMGINTNNNTKLPAKFDLSQNYPNPFNPATIIDFSIPVYSNVVLKIYDILGREVVTLVNKEMSAGNYNYNFNASALASGVYIYRLIANGNVLSKKMLLLK